MNLYRTLLLAGFAQLGILIASALVPRVFDWKEALCPLPEFLRRLFWVYGVFIVLTIIAFALLTLCHTEALAAGGPLARGLASFIAVFWGLRLLVQFFVFDPSPWLTTRWLRLGYHLLSLVFLFLTFTYTWAALAK